MGTTLIDNFSLRGRQFLDSRQSVATLAALKAVSANDIPDGFRAYCAEDGQWYEYNSSNTNNATTGKWRKTKTEVTQEVTEDIDTLPSNKAVFDSIFSSTFMVDVDKLTPLPDGHYTLKTAVSQGTPDKIKYRRKTGIVTFVNDAGEQEMWQLIPGNVWWDSDNWRKITPDTYFPLASQTTVNAMLNTLPVYSRKPGIVVSYEVGGETRYFRYKGPLHGTGDTYFNSFERIPIYEDVRCKMPYYEGIELVQPAATSDGTKSTGGYHGYEVGLTALRESGIRSITFKASRYRNDGTLNICYYAVYDSEGKIIKTYDEPGEECVSKWLTYEIGESDSKIRITYTEEAAWRGFTPSGVYLNSPRETDYFKVSDEIKSLDDRLYAEETITFEDPDEQAGESNYTYNNIGLVHLAKARETFNCVKVGLLRLPNQAAATGTLFVRKGPVVGADKGDVIKQVDGFSNTLLPASGMYDINLGRTVTLEPGEYLWVYFQGNNVTIRVWDSDSETGGRPGMYLNGKLNTYKRSTAMVLYQCKGDLAAIGERLDAIEQTVGSGGDSRINTPLMTLPEHLYVVAGREQTFYYNEFIYGIESDSDNTLANYNIGTSIAPSGSGRKCTASKEGFTIYTTIPGDYTLTVSVYDQFQNLLAKRMTTLHVVSLPSVTGKSILMLGDSWTDINSGNKGYTPYLDRAMKEMGVTLNFIGTRQAGTSGLKHEGIGGYAWTGFANAPSTVRFRFNVGTMPSISTDDVYSNNGSTFKLFEKGAGYITMSRVSGTTEPGGTELTRTSGTGDETITFTSWVPGGSNPLWNPVTGELDIAHYRSLCGLASKLDICNIQLGVNDSMGPLKTTRAEWTSTLQAMTKVIDAILSDSPDCKVIVNLAGLDCPSPTGWASLKGLTDSKRTYQLNNYSLRTFVIETLKARSDYGTNVFTGQSVLGINRWNGYGYTDRRYRYFRIADTMPEADLARLKAFDFQQRSVYVYTDEGEEFLAYGYDARGYLVCLDQQMFASWDRHDQEFVSVPRDTVPGAGTLTKGGGSASVDFPAVPYTECLIENNASKAHWFENASHPYDLGYRQMAYCLAHQVAALLTE